jgi:hypothetical protein
VIDVTSAAFRIRSATRGDLASLGRMGAQQEERVHRKVTAFIVILLLAGTASGSSPAGQAPSLSKVTSSATQDAAPDPVARADAAMTALQGALLSRLREEMARGGPPAAIAVCRDEAQAITARVAKEQGLALGRTSDRLRNPANAAPAWARETVAAGAGKRAAEAQQVTFDLGDRVGVLRPIGTADTCTNCHGAPSSISPEVRDVLAKAYPGDRATGFAPGDLRGWMWAEVPRR